MLVKDKTLTYLFWDIGVTSNKNANWTIPAGITVIPSLNGTFIEASSDYRYYMPNQALTGDFEVTCDVKSNGTCRVGFFDGIRNYDLWSFDTNNEWNYLKIKCVNDSLTAQKSVNGITWVNLNVVSINITSSTRYFDYSVYTFSTLIYKNLMIYEI